MRNAIVRRLLPLPHSDIPTRLVRRRRRLLLLLVLVLGLVVVQRACGPGQERHAEGGREGQRSGGSGRPRAASHSPLTLSGIRHPCVFPNTSPHLTSPAHGERGALQTHSSSHVAAVRREADAEGKGGEAQWVGLGWVVIKDVRQPSVLVLAHCALHP